MIKFLEYSDVHNEFGLFNIPVQPDEQNLGLVIAGDFHVPSNSSHYSIPLLREYSKRFAWVIYVLGNHECYGGAIPRTYEMIRDGVRNHPNHCANVHVLNDSTVTIGDVLFIGTTLWTDYCQGNPIVMFDSEMRIQDHNLILYGSVDDKFFRNFTPTDAQLLHYKSKKFIFDTIKQARAGKKPPRKIVVVTHHAPTFQSIPERFRGDKLNGAYASELGYDICANPPDYWFHGHIHDSFDYFVDSCHVLTNPRGYEGYEINPNFNPNFTIEV